VRAVPLAATTVTGNVPVPVALTSAVIGLQQPVFLTHAGDGSGDMFIAEKQGRIRRLTLGRLVTFLDITARVGSAGPEQWLLGLAFHPRYALNRQVFVNYTDSGSSTTSCTASRRWPRRPEAAPGRRELAGREPARL
jgi:hypothetical protein